MSNKSRAYIISTIEEIALNIAMNLAQDEPPPPFYLRNWQKWENTVFSDRLTLKPIGKASTKLVCFERKASQKTYAVIVYLLSKVHEIMRTSGVCTRRQLYYENVGFFEKQSVVDRGIQSICCLLDVNPWDLGVVGSSKGLVAGPLVLTLANGDTIDCNSPGGVLIPQQVINIVEARTSAKYILIVEKDATFQKLLDADGFSAINTAVLITGKGYPDMNTRLLVRRLADILDLEIFGLFDSDPYGIAIMCVYRFGSLSMSNYADLLATPELQWLGVHPSDGEQMDIPLEKMSKENEKFLKNLAKKPFILANPKLCEEVKKLSQSGHKAEIEALYEIHPNYQLQNYITEKIICGEYY